MVEKWHVEKRTGELGKGRCGVLFVESRIGGRIWREVGWWCPLW
jgi:hypothetical protein